MKNFVFLAIVALLTLAVLLFLFNPKLIQDVWLWIVGLIGPIIAVSKKGIDGIKGWFNKKENTPPAQAQNTTPKTSQDKIVEQLQSKIKLLEAEIGKESDPFDGVTFTVLRYFSDDDTTLGLFFLGTQFYCYTLEDAFHEKKIKGKTRIPGGTYKVDFYEVDTPLTKSYRKKLGSWFNFHIKIWDIPNFDNVYIHSGSDHTHTEGCLLIARSIYDDDDKKTIFHSRQTYKELYQKFEKIREEDTKVRIRIYDESWFKHLKMKPRT